MNNPTGINGLEWLHYVPFINYDDSLTGWSLFFSLISDTLVVGVILWIGATIWFRYQMKRLEENEKYFEHVRITSLPAITEDDQSAERALLLSQHSDQLVTGSIVLSHDAFRSISIFFRRIFGGEIKLFNRLVEQGRREAILRMKRDADDKGFNQVVNVRITTSTIAESKVELLAFGTGSYQ